MRAQEDVAITKTGFKENGEGANAKRIFPGENGG